MPLANLTEFYYNMDRHLIKLERACESKTRFMSPGNEPLHKKKKKKMITEK